MTVHPIPPVFDGRSRVLILGSFPSVRSRETGFYYGHPQNRFWKVLAALFQEDIPGTNEEKRAFLLEHGVALWDVIASCEITGSSDSSITHVTPNDLSRILDHAPVQAVFLNGKTAEKYFLRYGTSGREIPAVCLPSTSPANAARSLADLIEAWAPVGQAASEKEH